jgi:glycosyltransferase involved in cell wall biosynthesis
MRLAHFIQRYPPALGGSEAYFARLGRYLAAQGDAVTVFTSTALDLEAFWSPRSTRLPAGASVQDDVTVRRYAPLHWPGRRYVLKGLSFCPHPLWQCLTLPCNPVCPGMWRDAGKLDLACDAVHAAAFPYAWPIACARRLARRLRVPLLLTPFLHLGDPDDPADTTRRGYTAPALRWLLRQADAVFVQTPSERDAALRLGVAAERVQLQGLGVEPAECTGGDRSRARTSWNIREHEVVVGHLANHSREKGTIDLLCALERLWARGQPIRLVLAGPEMPNFRAFWRDFERRVPPAAVIRLGVVSEVQKKDFFAGIDVFALPSRSDSFGLVLLEAWANGVPNIAYRAGGVADVIRHERDGLLVPCGDLAALTAALERLCASAELRGQLGEQGRRRLGSDFRWEDKLALVRRVAGVLAKKDRTDPATRTLPTS